MAVKNKVKLKPAHKSVKKIAAKSVPSRNSSVSRGKATKHVIRKHSKSEHKHAAAKVELPDTSKTHEAQPKIVPLQKPRSKEYASAVHAYESGLKLMHAEEYERAIKAFQELIAEHTDEPEIQERARVLIHASEKKLQERAKTVVKSADDHYNVGVAELNRRELDSAEQHFQQALKLSHKGDHVLYALAAVNALKGNRESALSFLKQAIYIRPENRFLAGRDADFEGLADDADFKQLVNSSEK